MEEEGSSPSAAKKAKQTSVDKQIWLLTYGASCRSITHAMLLKCGLQVDECYTATWRESKYTLLHTERHHRLRKTGMDKVMQRLRREFQVVGTELFGFDSLSCNSRADGGLEDHPGFRILVERVNQQPSDLEWWIADGADALHAYRRGLLWKHIESTDPAQMTRAQLVDRVRRWAPLVKEVEDLKSVNAFLNDHTVALGQQNRVLLESLREERAFVDEMLKTRVAEAERRAQLDALS
jgi:hypothetical protein